MASVVTWSSVRPCDVGAIRGQPCRAKLQHRRQNGRIANYTVLDYAIRLRSSNLEQTSDV